MMPLPLFASLEKAADQTLPHLLTALDGRGWVKAKTLADELRTNDRVIREAASRSEGRIVSGQKGYCLTAQASVEDVQHAAAWLRSQAKQMTQRAYQIERALHRRAG